MALSFPSVDYIKYSDRENKIIHNFGPPLIIEEFEFLTTDPFGISSEGVSYYFVSDINTTFASELEYILLTSKKPTRRGFNDGTLKILRWLRHPLIQERQPQEVLNSWAGQFKFIKEDLVNETEGLRPPQIGALFAIMAHTQYAEDRAIVVMPTGTGKTEVMLSALLSIPCNKLLVTVPSDTLRTQLANKFITLGLLQQFGIISSAADKPIVGIMANRIGNRDQLSHFIEQCNVIITTMPLVAGFSEELRALVAGKISHLFVDEAHHSEAFTWSTFISGVQNIKVFFFTATPFRSDDRRLQGRFIFNFPLRAAQRDGYYKKMNLLPVREYDPQKADKKIAERAVQRLIEDRQQFPHILLARCANKKRAQEIAAIYEAYTQFRVALIYTGAPALGEKMRGVKNKEYDIVVCVDMLGEGFDLPELKIAAIHDERQGIPITLQFIGRFTRTSFNALGEASFITNLAYPPIQNELDRLYAHDADWNLLLPDISREQTDRQIDFQSFLEGFNGLDESAIPFQSIRPAMSATVYANTGDEWNPNRWREGIPSIDNYDHQFGKINSAGRTIVIILGQVVRVDWVVLIP
jgi:superfamily II DNA or RNA helicase